MTVRECIEYYQENICKSDSAIRSYDTIIKNFPVLINTELEDLKPAHIVQTLNASKIKDRTRFRYYSFIKCAVTRAIKDFNLKIKINLDGLFKNKSKEGGIKYLLLDDVKKIMAYEIPKNARCRMGKQYAKDLFLLMAMSGMAISDAMVFDPKKHITPDGKWFDYNRKKTDNKCLIPIIDDAREIIDRYKDKWPLGSKIGCVKTFHNHCRWIGEIVGKEVSSHTARKSMGSLFLQWGFSIESVAAFLGHSNHMTTATYYAEVTKQKIELEMDRIPKEVMSLK